MTTDLEKEIIVKKKRTTIYLYEEYLEDLKREAFENKTSVTAILEKLIVNHLKNYKASKNKETK